MIDSNPQEVSPLGQPETDRPPVVPGCDAPEPRPVYVARWGEDGCPAYECRCIVCARCGRHTGNSTQGHYWGWCRGRGAATAHHFCCPSDCELDTGGPRSLTPGPGRQSLIPPVHPMLADVVPPHLPRVGKRADAEPGG